ncbi:MAG TPA: hypothetical protein DCX14_06415 [Flavobacteriales bacterium]|jgi:uncharacterized protein YycO|nr:YiiX family permuted papain-like enzyme [Flavobacteriales bacterium]HAW19798.1 hypothetical protein [Flavobacteriales bacterium]
MRKYLAGFAMIGLAVGLYAFGHTSVQSVNKKKAVEKTEYQTGDIIYQSSNSGQSKAIKLATHSKYSHVGMIYILKGEVMVFEAVQPVRLTPFVEFIGRGTNKNYVVSRLKNADEILTAEVVKRMESQIDVHLGKSYDIHFDWSDDKMYCSELVWKIYKECANIEVGGLKPLKEYDLTHPVVKRTMEERYGRNIPYNEPMISPGAIFESELFRVIEDTEC